MVKIQITKFIFILSCLAFLSSCASVASLVSCCGQIPYTPSIKNADISIEITLENDGGLFLTQTIDFSCKYNGMDCRGGDWYSIWCSRPDELKLVFNIGSNRKVTAKLASCSILLEGNEKQRKLVYDKHLAGYWMEPSPELPGLVGDKYSEEFLKKYGFRIVDEVVIINKEIKHNKSLEIRR